MTLDEYITANLKRPFVWGSHDCVLFAAGWVRAATGKDYLAEFGQWTNARQAMRIVRNLGGLEKAINDRLTRLNPNLAEDGHIALYNGCMCLFSGPHIVGPNKNGLEFIDRTKAECAWHL